MRRRHLAAILRWLTTVLAVLLAATWFSAWTFMHLEHLAGPGWMVVPIVLTAGFLPATLLSRRVHARLLAAFNVVSGISVGFLSFFLFAAIACWIVVGAARLSGHGVDGRAVASAIYGAAALVGVFAVVQAQLLRVTRVTVPLENLPPFWRGRTIALATDIHLGNFRGTRFSRRLVSRLMALQPECVLIGGDMFDGSVIDLEGSVAPWASLSAPSGVYFVGGNHDDYGGLEVNLSALRGVGMRVLDNEKVDLHGLQLVGVHDEETLDPELYRAILERARLDAGCASILLAHRPSNLSVPEGAGISLQLSGHTHLGQFWPWTIFVRRVFGKFAYGLNRLGRMLVYTSSGAGTWGPPFRLGTRSEVVLIRLEAA
jgi:predicted MPP superfamily phosphohydrolase